jgi:acetyl-CoA carboxylase biotin carboxyl carrier protein
VNDSAPGFDGEAGGDADLLERVREAMVLLAGLPRSPEQLRIRVRGIEMELGWSTSAGPGPAAAPVVSPARDPESGSVGPVSARPRIVAPIVGTFYRSPEPGAAPFVQVGEEVKPGQQVAIVEAMKLMMPVEADEGGVIADILVADGLPVAYGEALFELDPVT